ncbi:MAG: hypothetical protein WBA17_05910 [Saprospiraceae bacterium]
MDSRFYFAMQENTLKPFLNVALVPESYFISGRTGDAPMGLSGIMGVGLTLGRVSLSSQLELPISPITEGSDNLNSSPSGRRRDRIGPMAAFGLNYRLFNF